MALSPATHEIQKIIDERVHREPELLKTEIYCLKEWIANEPHLPHDLDDTWLQKFFYGCKYNVETCKRKLDKYFTARSLIPEIFGNRDPLSEEFRDSLKVYTQFTLPCFTPDGYRVVFGSLLDYDSSRLSFDTIFKKMTVTGEYTLHAETCHGFLAIIDMQGATLSHALKITPSFARKAIFCLQDAFPFTLKGVHIINAPGFIDMVLRIFKFFMKKKMKKRIVVHSHYTDLFKTFPQEMLPNEYGGQAGTVIDLNESWHEKLVSFRDTLLADSNKKSDEMKREGKFPYKGFNNARKRLTDMKT